MTSLDRILAPVDLQSDVTPVLQLAIELARAHQARLIFLHVIDQSVIDAVHETSNKGYKGDFIQGVRRLTQERERQLEEMIPASHREGIEVELMVRKGSPAEKIMELARDFAMKLIVVGCGGHAGQGEPSRLGDVARQVLAESTCSVLLARPTEDVGTL